MTRYAPPVKTVAKQEADSFSLIEGTEESKTVLAPSTKKEMPVVLEESLL